MTGGARPPLRAKIMAFPRDPNPYQQLLYRAMAREGARVRFLGELTPSRTLNIALLPLEIAVRRLAGYRWIHLHWVFTFRLPGTDRWPVLGRLSQRWFEVVLAAARLVGARLVWTAHNVLPHAPVFPDDLRGRRALVRSADLVIAHSEGVLAELTGLGLEPRLAAVIPHGPFVTVLPDVEGRQRPDGVRTLLFAGNIAAYKGVEDLLSVYVQSPPGSTRLVIVGSCADRALAVRLDELARALPAQVRLQLTRLSDSQLAAELAAADVMVLPFRTVSTSGSAMLGLGAGLPLVVPDLPGLDDLPAAAVVRYDGSLTGLAETLARVAALPRSELVAMSEAAKSFVGSRSWEVVARQTLAALDYVGSHQRSAPELKVLTSKVVHGA